MVRVPEYQPSVRSRPILQTSLTVRANAEHMGAPAARGIEALGRGVGRTAEGLGNLSDAIAAVQAIEDETVARGARNDYLRDRDTLAHDPETGFLNKQGQAAIDGFSDYQSELNELRRRHGSKLTPRQLELFNRSTEPLELDARRSALIHKAGQLKVFVVEQATNGVDNFKNEALRHYRDNAAWQKYTGAGLAEIAGLGERLGWSPEKLKQEQNAFLSDTLRLTALQFAQDDPVAATDFALKHRDEMSAVDHLSLMRELLPTLSEAVTADRVAVDAANPGARQFAAAGLPDEAYSLLGVIAGTESPGYNVINGGQRFGSFADHPRQKGAGGTSTAAGRYQFVKATWDRVSKALGLPDFSPISQDVAAWWLAQQDYKSRTGRDLTADLKAGMYAAVREGLGKTWEGLHKLSDTEFSKRMQAAGGQPAQVADIKYSDRVQAMLGAMPANLAARLMEAADSGLATAQASQNKQINAARLAVTDNYKLRIATDDPSLTKQEILDDPVIDQGDKATLVTSFDERNKESLATQKGIDAFQAGRLVIDPYDSDGRKLVDNMWKSFSATVEPEQLRPMAERLIEQAGIVPLPIVNAMRADLTSGDPERVGIAASYAARIRQIDPATLERREGGTEIQDAAVAFAHLTDEVGLSDAMAAQRLVDMRDPEKMKARAALLESKPVKDFIKDQAVEGHVRDIFDPGILGFDPKLGETPAQAAAMVGEYASILEESMFDAAGDTALAKTLAADRFRRRYGTSEFTISGPKVITRLPPEITYPAGKDGTHGYIRDQVKDALSEAGIVAGDVYLQADHTTAQDVSAGRPARYAVFYEKDGMLERHPSYFYAAAPTPAALKAAAKARAETERDENREQLEAGRDREGTLDRYLDGNPLTGGLDAVR